MRQNETVNSIYVYFKVNSGSDIHFHKDIKSRGGVGAETWSIHKQSVSIHFYKGAPQCFVYSSHKYNMPLCCVCHINMGAAQPLYSTTSDVYDCRHKGSNNVVSYGRYTIPITGGYTSRDLCIN